MDKVDIIRLSVVYGNSNLLHQRILEKYGKWIPGFCKRYWIHVDDVCRAIIKINNPPIKNKSRIISLFGEIKRIDQIYYIQM